ncbi:hypothetical protein JYU34_002395 [Plutella xylostella]|uniref:Uncharacterized protein n=1 Tax=Plutella xylostella TaxID=51655 RepID=A0ABQ7R237_PLUXY|nr:hypothetical protein JYU34_002395 [Plutella xylostella]
MRWSSSRRTSMSMPSSSRRRRRHDLLLQATRPAGYAAGWRRACAARSAAAARCAPRATRCTTAIRRDGTTRDRPYPQISRQSAMFDHHCRQRPHRPCPRREEIS